MQLRILQENEDKTAKLFQSADCQALLHIYDAYYPKAGFSLPWVAYLVLRQDQVIGTCSFTGTPKDGKVEIAYWTFKEFEGQGIASFACKELIQIAQRAEPKITITAKTLPVKNASTRILEKNNFVYTEIVQDEEVGDAWLWTLKADKCSDLRKSAISAGKIDNLT
jgi:[ribosomal protein S5]-alanine N-acetyltransferase